MRKSQLRRLALDYAQGHVDHDSYVRERTDLIEAIVSGRVDIEREMAVPERPSAASAAETDPDPVVSPPPPRRLSPLHISLGGILIAVLAAVLLGGGDEPEPAAGTDAPGSPSPLVDAAPRSPPPAPARAPARVLVDDFLASNDWSATGLDDFVTRWAELEESARDEARTAPWFRPLSMAVKQEINAQRALAGLDGGAVARTEGRRLVAFARSLGVVGPFPNFEDSHTGRPLAAASPGVAASAVESAIDAPEADADVESIAAAQSGAETSTADAAQTTTESSTVDAAQTTTESSTVDAMSATAGPDAAPAAAGAGAVDAAAPDTPAPAAGALQASALADEGRRWLAGLADEAITLQLFAVNHLDEVARLVAEHTEFGFHVVPATAPAEPRYRLLQGPFSSREEGLRAHAALPEKLRRPPSPALLRSAGELRASVIAQTAPAAPAGPETAASPASTASVSGGYTLQLFASPQPEGVQRLLESYPDLPLRVHRDAGEGGAYRLLFGQFSSIDAARAGAATLPESLLQAVGNPLVKASDAPQGDTLSRTDLR